MYQRPCILQENIDDTKWIIRSRKSKKNEYYNCQKKKDIWTQGHRDTGTQGHRDIGTQGHRDTGTHNGGQNTAKNICNESYIIFSIASHY